MSNLKPSLPLGGICKAYSGVLLKEVGDMELVALSVAEGEEKKFATTFKKVFGKVAPKPLEIKPVKGGHVLWSTPTQYMALLEGENIQADADLMRTFECHGYATLQTDGWAHLAVSGERIMEVFERFVPLDMHGFEVGQATRTHAHHLAVIILRLSEDDYRFLTPRSSCEAFFEALEGVILRVTS